VITLQNKYYMRLVELLATTRGGAVASWLMCMILDQAVQVRALARDIVLCSWATHVTLTVPQSIQVQIGSGKFNAGA